MIPSPLHHESFAGPAAAPALVLLHGWGCHGGVWKGIVPLLREHFSVTVIDLPGFGRNTDRGWPASAAVLREALLAVAPPEALWVGWSLGGLLALQLAALQPGRIRAVSLFAASPCFVQRDDWQAAMPASSFAEFRAGLRTDATQMLLRFFALQCRGSVSQKADIRFLRQVQAAAPAPSAVTQSRALDFLEEEDARGGLAALACPLQVVLGERDALVPPALAAQLAALNPAAMVDVVGGAAHLPFVSHPLQCRDALLAFSRRAGMSA